MWDQFRRLLLGTVVELLVEADLDVRLRGLELAFEEESAFRVPRIDNYMRFKGRVIAPIEGGVTDAQIAALRGRLQKVWPELLAVVDLPVGDRLTLDRNDVEVDRVEGGLRVRFDLEAD